METSVNLEIPVGQWTDLYAESGFTRGTRLVVHNTGSSDIYLSTNMAMPDPDSEKYIIIKPRWLPFKNDGGDLGEWAFSPNQIGKLNVRQFTP